MFDFSFFLFFSLSPCEPPAGLFSHVSEALFQFFLVLFFHLCSGSRSHSHRRRDMVYTYIYESEASEVPLSSLFHSFLHSFFLSTGG